ncbi:hypothetical protein ONS95_014828 [Cadophora gregata]|uniref:uncharacterized protein n=1 Tax=Cadophora gregata TaxID=51156 RepID=UPI0026DB735B|nr:uncharacterized protein ONS95_014828 [Cadophora gregata]KAK0113128.1 hypothetical protein ONS95_014828 [Cadophora gregata]
MSSQFQNTIEGGDDVQVNQVLHGHSRESTPPDVANNLAPESASIRAPYLGEDSRVTLLRNLDDKFQNWASPLFVVNSVGGQLDNPITISIEMARVYQLITRGSIQVIEQLQSEKGQLEYDSWKLQVENQGLQQNNRQLPIEWHEMKARICFLESENDGLKVKHSALEKKEIEWERKVACLDKSNSNLREQLDAVERGYEDKAGGRGRPEQKKAQGRMKPEMYTRRRFLASP